MRRQLTLTVAAVAFVFALTVVCYWPSLAGGFIFDDVPNLAALGHRGGITGFAAFMEFVTTGQAGPLGRPLSLASFALNGQDWPTDPLPFRLTNLLIHLFNGLLVFLLSRALIATSYDDRTAHRLGLVCMALWLLHPLTASSTAYVIQRMTQLSTLFMIVGLLCYVHGRKMLGDQVQKGWAWMIGGMGASGLLAVLSKETGALLPAYALAIELTAFRSASLPDSQRRGLVAILSAPLLMIVGYFAIKWDAIVLGFDYRPYSMSERLLTQPVVLVEYLRQTILPQLSGLGVVHDDFPISTSLLSPASTLTSLVVLVALLGLAVWWRKRWPLVALGILWFFAGHSLEAGPLSLELYFDHRNYLPLLGPIIAVVSLVPAFPAKVRRLLPGFLLLILCFQALLTWQSARLWGNEDLMMTVALIDHPGSLRARQHVVNRNIVAGRYGEALALQLDVAKDFDTHTSTRLSILNLRCLTGELTTSQVNETRVFLESSSQDQQITGFLMPLLEVAASKQCPAFGLDQYHAVLDALLRNPLIVRNVRMTGAIHYFQGLAHHREGHTGEAVESLDRSFDAAPEIDIRIQQVVWLLDEGNAEAARRYLDYAQQYLAGRRWTRRTMVDDMRVLQARVTELERLSG